MLFKNLLILLLIASLASCSPKINSNFTKRYPKLQKSDTLKIFEPDAYAVRDNSKDELLGFVSVRDGGTTTNCSYDRMLQIVKDSAKANGGNIIGLQQHLEPSIWKSSCHQFYAEILKSDTNKIDSLGIPYTKNTKSNYYVSTYEEKKLENRVLFNFNAGVAFRIGIKNTSTEYLQALYNVLKTGTTLSISSLYKLNKDVNLGIKYSYNYYGGNIKNIRTTFPDGRPQEIGTYNVDQSVDFIAFNSYSTYPLGNGKNEIFINSSLGYVHYRETNGIDTQIKYSGSSFGYDLNLGYHRVISKYLRLGINIGIFSTKINNITMDDGITTKQYTLEAEESINLSNFNTGLHLNYSF